MADAQATFALTLDSSGLRSGVDSGLSALDRMRQKIQGLTKIVQGNKAAMDALRKAAPVARFDAITKTGGALEKASKEADRLGRKFSELQDAQGIAKQANVDPVELAKLEAEIEKVGAAYAKAKENASALSDEAKKLYDENDAVKAFTEHGKAAKAAESELADLQTAYSRAGGDASKLGDKVEAPTSGIKKLMEQAKGAGGPIGEFASKLEGLGGAAKVAGPLAILAVIIAITAAAIKAAYAVAQLAITSANAARNNQRQISNAALGSAEGAKQITDTMAALRDATAISKDEARGLAAELYRAGERGDALKDAALTIERFGQHSDEAKGSIKSLYDELRKPTPMIGGVANNSMIITKDMLPRDVFLDLATQLGKDGQRALVQGFSANKTQIRQALSRIGENRFAGPALEQMRSLDKLSERLRENLESLFEKLKIGVLLGALQKLVGLLDESSESGKAIRDVLGAFAQPFADAVEAALPYLEALFEGIIYTGLVVALMVLKIKNALADLIPSSLTKNIDWLNVAFWAGAAAMGVFIAAGLALATILVLLATPFLTVIGLVALLVTGIVMAIDAIVGWFDEVDAAFKDLDFGDAVQAITDGIIKAVEDSASDVWNAFKDLAKGGLNAFKSALGIKSPSLAFRLAGREIPRGAALGVEDESRKVENAASSMVGPGALEGGSGKASARGDGLTINVQAGAIVIQGATDPETTLEYLERALKTILRRAALEGGQPVEVPS